MQIVPRLHLVDGMAGGIVNAYVWERSDGGLTLIDAGLPADAAKILAFLETLGGRRLDRIIVTHADIDHVGGLAAVQAATRAHVTCHAVEKDVIEGRRVREMGDNLAASLYAPLFGLVTERFLGYQPLLRVDELVLDKQTLTEGFQVLHAPGHAAGQIALFHHEHGILIAGDAFRNNRGRLGLPSAISTPRMDIAKDSIRRLAELKGIETICCGHGPPITRNAEARLRAFAASLDSPSK